MTKISTFKIVLIYLICNTSLLLVFKYRYQLMLENTENTPTHIYEIPNDQKHHLNIKNNKQAMAPLRPSPPNS